jgi:glycosyltransferase involved in cell wall biosynthesis
MPPAAVPRRRLLMRVLHVIPSVSLEDGGPARAIAMMERALSAAGASVTVMTTDFDAPSPADGAAGEAPPGRVNVRRWTNAYKLAPGAVPWLWRNVRRFDVVHIHALFSFVSVAAGAIASARAVPFVIRPLGTLAEYGVTRRRPFLKRLSLRLVEGPILRRAGFVHCTSEAELAEARSHGIAFRGGVIPLGVERPVPNGARPAAAGGSPRRILFLSRIDPKKNLAGLLRAFALLAGRHPAAVLTIAGSGPSAYVTELKSLAGKLALADRIEWPGFVDGEAKSALLASADVFVLPSFSENFGIAAVEAMLSGLPAVLGRGVAVATAAAAAGAAVAVGTEPEEIAAAIDRLLADDDGRRRLGATTQAWAERQYSTEAMAGRLLDLYAGLARPRRTRAA